MNSRRFCFTLNNPVQDEQETLSNLGDTVRYLILGNEVGESGTPHIQGFVVFHSPVSFIEAKRRIGERAHIEVARGSSVQASEYCKKDGDYVEVGKLPDGQGKRTDWEKYKEWIVGLGRRPSSREILLEFPHLYARYRTACIEYADALNETIKLTDGEPRFGWQTRVKGIIDGEVHDRKVYFVVDIVGNKGKSWFCKYALSTYPERVQVLRVARRDDMCYCIDVDKDVFLFDVPRAQMEFLQYSVLEMIKDRMVFSPKYMSTMKVLRKESHVIVFCNELPDNTKMSLDRFEVINI